MKIHRSAGFIHIDLSGAEAAWLLEELETVPRGSKFPKIRQVCEALKQSLALDAAMVPKGGRPKSAALVTISPETSAAAAQLGRLGGLKGGEARALALTAEERSEIAKRAADARWSREPDVMKGFQPKKEDPPWDADEGDP